MRDLWSDMLVEHGADALHKAWDKSPTRKIVGECWVDSFKVVKSKETKYTKKETIEKQSYLCAVLECGHKIRKVSGMPKTKTKCLQCGFNQGLD